METNSATPVIWAVSDGRAGNVAMAMGLAERVADLTKGRAIQRDLQVSGPRAWLAAHLPFFPSRLQMATYPVPTLVIGAGRRVAPAVSALRKTGVKAVQILDPKMAPRCFDMIVAPQHDGLAAPNALTTLGSVGRVTPALLADAREAWTPRFAHLRRPLIAVLVGGDTKRKKVTKADWRRFANDLAALSETAGMILTLSRRSGTVGEAILREALPDAMIWDGQGDNPYFGMLACANAIIVTDDSVNMASEAAGSGAPVAIYPLLREGGKIAHFHAALIALNHAVWFEGKIPTATQATLDETQRAAQAVAALISP